MNSKQHKYVHIYVRSNSANVLLSYTERMFNPICEHMDVPAQLHWACYPSVHFYLQCNTNSHTAECYVSYRGHGMTFFC